MARSEELQKHTLNLRAGDMDRLRDLFPDIPPSNMIRTIVSRYVDDLEGQRSLPNVEVSL
jgi:hypothetical protein